MCLLSLIASVRNELESVRARKSDGDVSEAEEKVSSKFLVYQLNYIVQITTCQLLSAASSQEQRKYCLLFPNC